MEMPAWGVSSRRDGILELGWMPRQLPPMTPEPAPTVQQLLAFYLEAGVDCALTDEPVNRLSDPASSPAIAAPRRSEPARSPSVRTPPAAMPAPRGETAPAPEAAIQSAREAARTAPTLEALRALLEKFDGCALKYTATRLVFADGNPQARIMFVGEAPGRDEDIEGLPFVGRSGKLLDRMIAAIGLDRSNAYIANVIPWRPPGNRTPTPQETQICLPFIQRQIELVNPDVLVTLGNPSTQTLLSTREGIMRTRGRWFDYDTGTRTIRAMATFHPAYLLRSPSYKRHVVAGSARDREGAGAGCGWLRTTQRPRIQSSLVSRMRLRTSTTLTSLAVEIGLQPLRKHRAPGAYRILVSPVGIELRRRDTGIIGDAVSSQRQCFRHRGTHYPEQGVRCGDPAQGPAAKPEDQESRGVARQHFRGRVAKSDLPHAEPEQHEQPDEITAEAAGRGNQRWSDPRHPRRSRSSNLPADSNPSHARFLKLLDL